MIGSLQGAITQRAELPLTNRGFLIWPQLHGLRLAVACWVDCSDIRPTPRYLVLQLRNAPLPSVASLFDSIDRDPFAWLTLQVPPEYLLEIEEGQEASIESQLRGLDALLTRPRVLLRRPSNLEGHADWLRYLASHLPGFLSSRVAIGQGLTKWPPLHTSCLAVDAPSDQDQVLPFWRLNPGPLYELGKILASDPLAPAEKIPWLLCLLFTSGRYAALVRTELRQACTEATWRRALPHLRRLRLKRIRYRNRSFHLRR